MDVLIREARPEDADALLIYLRDHLAQTEINGPLTFEEFGRSVQEEKELLAWYAAEENSAFFLAMHGDEIIGEISLKGGRLAAMQHEAFLGMSVAWNWRGQGVGQQLLKHSIEWARENPILTRIELGVYTTNEAAFHIYKKAGFQVEGLRRRKFRHGDQYFDDYCMAIYLGE